MLILGLNAHHGDSSACLLKDGQLIAVVEEERFRRIKHWAGFPSEAIRWCLEEAKIFLANVSMSPSKATPEHSFCKSSALPLNKRSDLQLILDRVRNRKERQGVEQELEEMFSGETFSGEVHRVEHHLAHLASAHWASPFP